MDCPRCGGSLSEYRLDERAATVCEDCGYLDLAAELNGEPEANESWDEALSRYQDQTGDHSTKYHMVRIGAGRYRIPEDLFDRIQRLTAEERSILREFLRDADRIDPNRSYTDIANAVGVSRRRVSEVFLNHQETLEALADCEVTRSRA